MSEKGSWALTNELRSARITVDGLNVHYLTGGQGDPLLVVHGGTGGAQDWRTNMEKLTDKYILIPYGRRISAMAFALFK